MASLVAQMVKNLPAMWETRVWSLGWEGPLGKGMATYTSILAWRIPWTQEPGGLQSVGSQRVGHDWATNTHTHTHTENGSSELNSVQRRATKVMPRKKMMQEDRLKRWLLCHLEIWSLKKGTVGSAKMKNQEGNWDDGVTAGTGCLSWREPQSLSDLPAAFYSGWRTGVRKEEAHFQTAGQVGRKAESQSAFCTCWEAYVQSMLEELVS